MIRYHIIFLKVLSLIDESSSYFKLDVMESCTKEVVLKICTDKPLTIGMVDILKFTNLEVLG